MKKQIELTLAQAREIYGKSNEVDAFLLQKFSEKDLVPPKLPKTWEELQDLKEVNGFFITSDATIKADDGFDKNTDINNFFTKQLAKSALAMAQLSQLMAVYNGNWVPNWFSSMHTVENTKYCICRYNNNIETKEYQTRWAFLAFETAENRDEFLKNFYPLIRDYFMLD